MTTADGTPPANSRTSKRRRGRGGALPSGDDGSGGKHDNAYLPSSDEGEDGDEDLFVAQDDAEEEDDDDDYTTAAPRPAKRRKDDASAAEHEEGRDDKKKLAMDISYEGFAIYGRVLCLVVKRRAGSAGGKGKGVAVRAADGRGNKSAPSSAAPGGQATMENWITSTQMPDAVANGLLDAS